MLSKEVQKRISEALAPILADTVMTEPAFILVLARDGDELSVACAGDMEEALYAAQELDLARRAEQDFEELKRRHQQRQAAQNERFNRFIKNRADFVREKTERRGKA